MMCRCLGVTTAGYYAWCARRDQPLPEGCPRAKRVALAAKLTELFFVHKGFGGARTIKADLDNLGIEASFYAVRKVMKDLGLRAKYRRAFKKTTVQDPNAKRRDDLVNRQFYPPVPTTTLCGDITYLRTAQGWMYLATVIDLSTRMVVGWQAACRMKTGLRDRTLTMAHHSGYVARKECGAERQCGEGNAFSFSDRGSQYTSEEFAAYAASIDVRLSVGKVGVCWDNTVAESFFATLKLHLLYDRKHFNSKLEARVAVGEWIEAYYNRRRIHSTTGEIPAKAMKAFLRPTKSTATKAA